MNVVDAKREYFQAATGSEKGSVAELESLFYQQAAAGTAVVVPEATPTVEGTVKQVAFQPNAAGAAPVAAEYDALLAALIAAGVMAAS